MPAYPRKTQKVFGESLTPAGNVAQFGSLAAGSPVYSNDLATIQALAAWGNGFQAAIIGSKSPTMEDFNGLILLITQQIGYLLQSGVPEWISTTTYYVGNYCRVANVLYVSQSNNNAGHDPTTDSNNWQPYLAQAVGPRTALAWVEFDGINATAGNARIINSTGVSTVTKNADGNYTVNFSPALPSANYVFFGSCGSEDGQTYGAGDDGVVVGNVTGQGNAVRSTSACRIFTINPTSKALVASGCVSFIVFGS